MSMIVRVDVVAVLFSAFIPHANADEPLPGSFGAFVDEYYQSLFNWDPTQATYAGVHQLDDRLSDMSSANIVRRVTALKNMRERLMAIQPAKLNENDRIDSIVLDHSIQA